MTVPCVMAARIRSVPRWQNGQRAIVHPAIACARNVCTDTIICFPVRCAYRRLLHAWLAAGNIVPEKVLELRVSPKSPYAASR